MTASNLEAMLALHIRAWDLPEPVVEYRFDPVRQWRVDFAWPLHTLAVEVEGGLWRRGRHIRPSGFEADCDKYNALALKGWRLLRFTGDQVKKGTAVRTIKEALER